MRVIVIGTEYTGKTTLVTAIQKWGLERGIRHHMDDHFTIPDQQTLTNPADQKAMTEIPSAIKERFQRFQIAYHVRLLNKYEHILLTGFHIEEAVYGPRYYYPEIKRPIENPLSWEKDMPNDVILVLLTAKPDVIKQRMKTTPHTYPVVPESDIEDVQAAFQEEFRTSFSRRKFQIDTSGHTPESLLRAFLDESFQYLNPTDLLIRQINP